MQYTGSSFVWKLIRSFRHIACSKRELRIPEKCFPARGELFTASTDLALERIYTPLFSGLARFFERLWPLQHGRIQLYLLYMVATVLTVFLIEKWSDCFPGHDALGQTIGVSDSEFEWRGQDCRFHPVFAQEGHHVE